MSAAKLRSAIFLISLGGVLLLNNLGYVSWGVWGKIIWLWPLILIAWGMEKLFKGGSLSFLAYLSPILILVWFWVPVYLYKGDWGGYAFFSKNYEIKKMFDNKTKQGELFIYHRGGEIVLSSDSLNLLFSDLDYWKKKPDYNYSFSDSDSVATIEIRDWKRRTKNWHWFEGLEGEWKFNLGNRIPWDVQIDARNSSGDLDLSDLEIKNLRVYFIRDKFRIKFGEKSDSVFARIEGDDGKLKILFPKEVGLQIEKQGGLENASFSNISLQKEENFYTTANYVDAVKKIKLVLEGEIENLEVETY